MKKSSLYFSAFVLLGFISAASPSAAAPVDLTKHKAPVLVACVGDSITQGMGADPGLDWPSQLWNLLDADKWTVKNFGLWGCTVLKKGDKPYWDQQVFKDSHAANPDVVIIMLGTNDTKPQNWAHHEELSGDYKALIDSYKSLPSNPHIYICLPPPGPPPGKWGINEPDLLLEIPILTKLAADENADLIDMHTPLVGQNMQPDTVHPNDFGAGVIARAAFAALTGHPAPPKP